MSVFQEYLASNYYFLVAFAITVTSLSIICFTPMTRLIGLVDKPNRRKVHSGSIPLIGGLAIFASVILASLIFIDASVELMYFLSAAGLVTLAGALDDRFDINFRVRLIIQALAGLILIYGAQDRLTSLGNVAGPFEVSLWAFAVPFTVFAIVGVINAYNMVDGIDGLAGALALVAIIGIYLMTKGRISSESVAILALISGSLVSYLAFNLHLFPRFTSKIFMGDAGSMFLGFVITAFLIRYSQGDKEVFAPVSALWIVAVPVFDLVSTTLRRIRHGKSPFHPDRTHMHHIFTRAGFSARATLVILTTYAALLLAFGLAIQGLHETLQLILFILAFAFHVLLVSRAWRFAKRLRRLKSSSIKKMFLRERVVR
ncbi:undecaprenyl-phosphate alpha-N-acetylglucosaminyl 1-phosphate transferase [Salinibius halmophilus]|uniref:undecaprenyl-phosphate alpha-N-acetylglucosaminyl 1-phosphate transferase n=1 Tax=Salinibius halmophilus TaxID=1853216 RepID=UPI000E66A8C6|nr:undecaprenyl-phosphate alpha-N-acetylglucosaminyl 1-phosphate transferase [Salinibius halmophilus]